MIKKLGFINYSQRLRICPVPAFTQPGDTQKISLFKATHFLCMSSWYGVYALLATGNLNNNSDAHEFVCQMNHKIFRLKLPHFGTYIQRCHQQSL